MLARTLLVGLGGFVGAAARYVAAGAIYRYLDEMVKEGLVTIEKATVIFYRAGEAARA